MLLPGMTGIKNELMKGGAKKKNYNEISVDSHERAVECSQIPIQTDLLHHQTMFAKVKVKITVSLSLGFVVFRPNSSGLGHIICLCGETVYKKKLLLLYNLKLFFRLLVLACTQFKFLLKS